MNIILQSFLIAFVLVFLAVMIYYLARRKLNLKYSLTWLAAGFVMLILVLFPQLVSIIGDFVGIVSQVNTVFLFAGLFSLAIIFTLTIIVSHLNDKIIRLTQSQALLEKRIRELEEQKPDTEASHELTNRE